MALVVADRVLQTSSTAGMGTLTLSGTPAGYQSFASGIGNGNTTYYTIYDPTAAVWEVGLGTVGVGTLARTTVLSNSSGTTSPLTLAGNTVNVWCDYPAGKAVYADGGGNVLLGGDLNVTGTTTLATSLSGILKSSSGVVSNATSGTDYAPATSGTSILSGSGSGGFSNVTVGTGLSFSGGTLSNTITSPFAAGTAIVFAQAAAPTGWTKSITNNNKALRVVSGTGGGSGGSVAFTTAFASQTPSGSISTSLSADATTLTTTQIPSHQHSAGPDVYNTPANQGGIASGRSQGGYSINTGATGGGGSHTHTVSGSATFTGTAINLAVQYVDVIICTKD